MLRVFNLWKQTDKKRNLNKSYFAVVIDTEYEAMDKENPKYTKPFPTYSIEELVLDKKILQDIPLKKRLILYY